MVSRTRPWQLVKKRKDWGRETVVEVRLNELSVWESRKGRSPDRLICQEVVAILSVTEMRELAAALLEEASASQAGKIQSSCRMEGGDYDRQCEGFLEEALEHLWRARRALHGVHRQVPWDKDKERASHVSRSASRAVEQITDASIGISELLRFAYPTHDSAAGDQHPQSDVRLGITSDE